MSEHQKIVHSEGSDEFVHTHNLARAFTACLLKVVDIQVRKLSTLSPKDVDCILANYIAYQSSNNTLFCSVLIHLLISIFLYCRHPRGHFGKVTVRWALKNKEKVKERQ